VFWSDKEIYVSFDAPQTEWLDYFNGLCQTKSVTDIVLYGDTRPIHQLAIKSAKECEINVHIFEESYLRPYWITYERDGANGHSRLMDITLDQIKNATLGPFERSAPPPDHWGDTRQCVVLRCPLSLVCDVQKPQVSAFRAPSQCHCWSGIKMEPAAIISKTISSHFKMACYKEDYQKFKALPSCSYAARTRCSLSKPFPVFDK